MRTMQCKDINRLVTIVLLISIITTTITFAKKVTVSNVKLPKDTFGNTLITGEASVLQDVDKYYYCLPTFSFLLSLTTRQML